MRYLSFAGLVVFFLASASANAAIECQVSNSISGQQVSNLPLNGRDFQNLATITPGEATSRLAWQMTCTTPPNTPAVHGDIDVDSGGLSFTGRTISDGTSEAVVINPSTGVPLGTPASKPVPFLSTL